MNDEERKKLSAKRTRRSFLAAALGAGGGYGFYRWIDRASDEESLSSPLRKALRFNQAVSTGLFDERGLAPTYDVGRSVELRINGNYGLKQDLMLESYRLQVVGVAQARRFRQYVSDVTAWQYRYAEGPSKYDGHDTKEAPKAGANGGAQTKPRRGMEEAGQSHSTLHPDTPGLLLTMEDIRALPKQELVTQFKCIEGWSEIVHWGGMRLRDFVEAYPPAKNEAGALPKYVYMETPNGDYYCGFDLQECMHPQSLLVTEMAGKPLAQQHGAPLRLHMPIKYGYKQIKRIGLIAYTDLKPDDYWTKLGYDWYAGL